MKSGLRWSLSCIITFLCLPFLLPAQTFRGGISGTVTDATGAVIANAKVILVGTDTGFTRDSVSTSAGEFAFQDLQLGNYSIEVKADGFDEKKVSAIAVRPGQVYSLVVKLSVAAAAQTVEVSADSLTLDTQSSTGNAVISNQAVANIPLNGRDFTQLVKIAPGYNGAGSINGTRTNQNNWQIDGADDNDIWQNNTAANQGGVAGIAGVTIPVDSIDQFTVQTEGNAEAGRNAGALISLGIKTGTNNYHGAAYYFNRNEFFAEKNPFTAEAARKPLLRNQQFGADAGGPIVKNRVFFFLNFERQQYTIQVGSGDTEPVAAYVTEAQNLLAAHNVAVSPLSMNLLKLWPKGNATGYTAGQGNYTETNPSHGYSNNAIGNINWNISDRQSLRLQSFVGTGRQFAPVVNPSTYWYYQVAPDITQNFSITHNWAITSHFSNQLLAAVGIFNQTFNDENHSWNMPSLGLADGVTNPSLFGAPTISISDSVTFDEVGATQPIGRKDYTGHITDAATWVHGRHQMRFGGEFRRNYIDLQYQSGVRGNFSFNGAASANVAAALATSGGTPWATSSGAFLNSSDASIAGNHTEVLALADFLSGYFTKASFIQGFLRRSLYQKSVSFFAQDQFQASTALTLNYGIRYEYLGTITTDGVLSVFRPGTPGTDANGLLLVGASGEPPVYTPGKLHFAPRFGFAYQASPKFVVRGNFGIYYDSPSFNGFGNSNGPDSDSATGFQANPVGTPPVLNVSRTYSQWQNNVNPFSGAAASSATTGLFSVDPNLHTAYAENYTLNTEYQLTQNTLFTLGYLGAQGRHLYSLLDINQPTPGTVAGEQSRRPYYSSALIPNAAKVGIINQVSSAGGSNYNALVTSLKTSNYHHVSGQVSYTLGHSLDTISNFRNTEPENSEKLAQDYGSSDFDVRNTLNAYLVYEAPQIGHSLAALTRGWQLDVFTTTFTGTPFSVKAGSDLSGTAENSDRVNVLPGVSYKTATGTNLVPATSPTAARYAVYLNSAAFTNPSQGTWGNSSRNAFRGPNFFTLDSSVVKNTQIREGVSFQFRAEIFNLFNRTNLANPSASNPVGSASFGRITATRNNGGAPGIGPGEPFNVQFAGKIIF
jgi:hypothetical protein